MSLLRDERGAQVILAAILGGTRFKYFFHKVLAPAACPDVVNGRVCWSVDSFSHLLYGYGADGDPGADEHSGQGALSVCCGLTCLCHTSDF